MLKYLIAHDLGTSGNKASLFSSEGDLITSYTASYNVNFFGQNCAEQNPEDWWEAICLSTRQITAGINPSDILAISFSGQMSSCIIVDKNGNALRPALIWADQRAVKQAKQLENKIGFDHMYELTGHRVSSSYSLEKLMWIKENEPDLYNRTHCMLMAKDYIIHHLTGKFVTDYSDASGTNALDLQNLCWSDEILNAAGIPVTLLPELHESTDIIGNLTPAAAKLLGLTTSTVVVCGGGDGPCSAVGAGCTTPNHMFLTFGTSAWIGGTTPEVFLDSKKVLFCFAHVIPGQYMPCATMQAAGSAYSYIKNTFCQEEIKEAAKSGQSVYELLDQLVKKSPVGAKGLLFLPYMLGERSPRWNPDTSGSFLGIKMEHDRPDYIRAVLEGIAMNLDLILKAYQEQMNIDKMILTGGGAKGDVLTQILADTLNVSLTRPNHVETATSIAAAMIAGVGIGIYKDFSQVSRFLRMKDTTVPIPEHVKIYEEKLPVFDKAYYCLEKMYNM